MTSQNINILNNSMQCASFSKNGERCLKNVAVDNLCNEHYEVLKKSEEQPGLYEDKVDEINREYKIKGKSTNTEVIRIDDGLNAYTLEKRINGVIKKKSKFIGEVLVSENNYDENGKLDHYQSGNYPSGKQAYSYTYVNGVLNGSQAQWYNAPNKKYTQMHYYYHYINGKKNGKQQTFNIDGTVREDAEYIDDINIDKNCKCVERKITTGKNNKGNWKIIDTYLDDIIRKKEHYVNDIKIGETNYDIFGKLSGIYTEFYLDGSKKSKIHFLNDMFHETNEAWYKNGKYEVLQHFWLGKNVSNYITWHENGQHKVIGCYNDNGLKCNIWEEYDQSGVLKSKVEYEDDKIIEIYK
jgi:antitoxin component YwqK of YwqJK toxin-antitoxin module